MADYFTHFSCALDVVTADNAARALELYRHFSDELETEEQTPGFDLVATPTAEQPALLWIYDDNAPATPTTSWPSSANSAPPSASPACGDSNGRTPVQSPASKPSAAALLSSTSPPAKRSAQSAAMNG